MPPHKTESTLRRGTACLSCRKRKLKCDGIRPVCRQCTKMNRANLCEYDDKQQKSRTQLLKEQLAQLESRLKELESNHPISIDNAPSPHFQFEFDPYAIDSFHDPKYPAPLFNLPPTSTTPSPTPSESSSHSNLLLRPTSSYSYHSNADSPASLTTSLPGSPSHRDPRASLPPRAKQYLLEVFIAHKQQCWFYVSVDRFLDRSPPRGVEFEPHPALINAMYLLACYFSHKQIYTEMEPAFLIQAQRDINTALDNSDRLPDIVQASSLLAVYLYMNNRTMEGYRHTFSAIRLAVGLGLHQIQPSSMMGTVYPAQIPLIPIAPPRDNVELNDRILAFWQVFMVDRCFAVANDVPLALPDKDSAQCRILTPWPSSEGISQWHDSGLLPLRSLFEGSDIADSSDQFMPAMKAKVIALYELTSRTKHAADVNDWGYRLAEAAVQRFSLTIPANIPIDRDYFMIQTVLYAAFIHLQRHVLFDPRAFKAGNSIVRLVHQLTGSDWEFLDPIVAVCWSSTADMFMYTLATNTLNGDAGSIISACNAGLDVITHALNTYGAYSPLARDRAVKLKLARV